MTIGEKLVMLREGRSQREVAEAVNISQSALGMYERNERVPRDEIKIRLSNYYGVSVQELFFSLDDHDSWVKGDNKGA